MGNHQFHFGHVMLETPIRHRSREAEWTVIYASLEFDVCGGGRLSLEI